MFSCKCSKMPFFCTKTDYASSFPSLYKLLIYKYIHYKCSKCSIVRIKNILSFVRKTGKICYISYICYTGHCATASYSNVRNFLGENFLHFCFICYIFLHREVPFGTKIAGIPTPKKAEIMAVFGIDKIERKEIPGYGGRYEVGSDGSVWGCGMELQKIGGYVNLSWKGRMDKAKVCYLVARAFVPNAEGRPWVVHKNGVAGDDRAENLEWSERKEELRGRKSAKVGVVSVWRKEDGELVGSWASLEEACLALGVEERSARRQLRGGAKSVKGFIFKV